MKTLIYEPDPERAQGHVARLREGSSLVEVARSLAEARVKLLNNHYDRLALRRGTGAVQALLGVARATSPACVMIDLGSMRSRPLTGPNLEAETSLSLAE
jgi:hypothetical protein